MFFLDHFQDLMRTRQVGFAVSPVTHQEFMAYCALWHVEDGMRQRIWGMHGRLEDFQRSLDSANDS